jgi:hypothetical protein
MFLLAAQSMFAQKGEVTFSDEFDGTELDLAKWSPHDPLVKTTERQNNFSVSGGLLHADGIMSTFGTFSQTFGRVEIRCRVTSAKVRLLPLQLATLPMVEILGIAAARPSAYEFGNHWGTEQTRRSYSDSFPGPDISAGFHTIAMEWDAGHIAWFIDGKERFRSTEGIARQPVFLWLDLQGDVDYIHVYRH